MTFSTCVVGAGISQVKRKPPPMTTAATTKVTIKIAFDIDPRALATFLDETTCWTATRQSPARSATLWRHGLAWSRRHYARFRLWPIYGSLSALRIRRNGPPDPATRDPATPDSATPAAGAGRDAGRRRRPPAQPPTGPAPPGRTIVLVGLMGVGKSCIGRRLATRLSLPFRDADAEIERAAGCSIEDIFELHGEAAFREGESRVIRRLLAGAPHVLATGGGAFMDPHTRAAIAERAVSVWLRADLELMLKRTGRRNNRPLLKRGNPRDILAGPQGPALSGLRRRRPGRRQCRRAARGDRRTGPGRAAGTAGAIGRPARIEGAEA